MRILLGAMLVFIALSCASVNESFDEGAWRTQIQKEDPAMLQAPHFKDGSYFNPWLPMKHRAFGSYVMMRLFGKKAAYTKKEKEYLPKVLPDTAEWLREMPGDFILWIGHATFLIHINGEYWLTDPVFSRRALVPARKTPPALTARDLADLDGPLNVVISHDHYDHLDKASIEALPPGTHFYVPLGIGKLVKKFGAHDVREMDWWDEATTPAGTRLVCLPTQHWSRRILESVNSTLWAGFLIAAPAAKVYYAGDSGYFIGFREIGRRYPGIDYALMPITAYRPRWFMHYSHMDVRESIDAFRDLGARFFIPTQWGTFHLGEEPAGYGALDLQREIIAQKLDPVKFMIMAIGEIASIP